MLTGPGRSHIEYPFLLFLFTGLFLSIEEDPRQAPEIIHMQSHQMSGPVMINLHGFTSLAVHPCLATGQDYEREFQTFGLMDAEDLDRIQAFFRKTAFTFLFHFRDPPFKGCDDALQRGCSLPPHFFRKETNLLEIGHPLFPMVGTGGQHHHW